MRFQRLVIFHGPKAKHRSYQITFQHTKFQSGGGFLPRQKLERVHVAFLSIEILLFSWSKASKGKSEFSRSTMSRQRGLSPAMFPSAQTAYRHDIIAIRYKCVSCFDELKTRDMLILLLTCSLTSATGLLNNWTKNGTAPASMTNCVWTEVPEAMLVKAQAASN